MRPVVAASAGDVNGLRAYPCVNEAEQPAPSSLLLHLAR